MCQIADIFSFDTLWKKIKIKRCALHRHTRSSALHGQMFFAKYGALPVSLGWTVSALWNAGGRKTVFLRKHKSAITFDAVTSAWCLFYHICTVPRHGAWCKRKSPRICSLFTMAKKVEKWRFWGGFCLPVNSWLRPWVPKVLFKALLDETYTMQKTASRYLNK